MLKKPLLKKPLSISQIEAAVEFWNEIGWEREAEEFAQLRKCFPKPQDGVTLKAIVLNTLYNTNVIAISRAAECLKRTLNAGYSTGPDLVEQLVAEIKKVTKRENYVFVAKFAHFFIDQDLPILDKYAEDMVHAHLGKANRSTEQKRCLRFAKDVANLKELACLTCNCAQLDSYLWVAGEYWGWKKKPTLRISRDLRGHFERLEQSPENERALRTLLGIGLSGADA
jgi:hypothetical protein